MKTQLFVLSLILLSLTFSCNTKNQKSAKPDSEWTNLLDKDLSQWDIYLGVAHKSSGIPGYENSETMKDIQTGTALGLGNKKNVFSVVEENNEEVLKITGEIFGALVSKQAYENYHLTFQVKWGEKKWEPRLEALRNNGVLYHSIGEFGAGLWKTWMSSLEFEVEETNFGDFITINDAYVRAKSPAVKKDNGNFHFAPGADLQNFNWTDEETGRNYKSSDQEKVFGEWNTLELICFGDTSIHIVNGEVVMVVYQAEFFNGSDWIPMQKGKIQIQSEAAETYYKNIKIKSINALEAVI